MEPRSLKFIASASGGCLQGRVADAEVLRVCTDSRHVRAGDLFIAIKGDRFDGHNYMQEAVSKGAVALLVNDDAAPAAAPGVPLIRVPDTVAAMGRLASAYGADFSPVRIAVCGSNGKTTTKELIASVLGRKMETLKNQSSFNNHIGVPVTLLATDSRHKAAVLEAGTNHPRELAPLLGMIRPRMGVVTSIGREHLEHFGDIAGVAEEEGAIADVLPATGKLFLNGDSPEIDRIARRAGCPVVRVGESALCDLRALQISVGADGTRFTCRTNGPLDGAAMWVRMPGRHHAVNALFAAGIGVELGLDVPEIIRGLEACEPPPMRSRVERWNGVTVLNDAYNANADSMIAALETLAAMECPGRRVAVIGDMAELGAQTGAAHAEAGLKAAQLGLHRLVAVGRFASTTAGEARRHGLGDVMEFGSVDEAGAALAGLVADGDVLLVKASRSAGLERVLNGLKAT